MERTTIDFGIDLGTTNSTIAVIDEIDAKVIPNKGGSSITPSAVWLDKRGNLHVGQEAKLRALVEDRKNADLEFKLRMGRGADGKKVFERSKREMYPEEMSAEVLKALKTDVRSNMGEELTAAVITVPAAFENPQTTATRRAACGTTEQEVRLGARPMAGAGLQQCVLLLEPVAASLAYGFQTESENVYWFVYDFGGGTFDAAVMRIRDGLIQVVNHDGDNFLGGKLIDWDIVTKKLIPSITAQYNLPGFSRGSERWENAIGKMKYYAEQAKIDVCRSEAPAEVWIESLCEDADGKEVDFAYTLTPEDVQEVSQPFIERSLELCRSTLKATGLSGSNMERILMVGGTTLNPWVRNAVKSELGSQLEFGVDPVTVVARGAAIFASTQPLSDTHSVAVPEGTWRIQIEHKPVGNVTDPDIGGRVVAPDGHSAEGCTIEFVDLKTQWRSGRVTLSTEGIFMTQLYAEKHRRHEYGIELCDSTGTRIPASPSQVAYTLGVIPEENPPAAMTIGVGLADGSVARYVSKGTRLPCRKTLDHYTVFPLRAGHAEDVLRIPLIEGEQPRADRNHGIGVLLITGADIRRDLPAGSPIEVTLRMDTSQQIRMHAYVNPLDEDFDVSFEGLMESKSIAELRDDGMAQKNRLAEIRDKAASMEALAATAILSQIEDQQLISQIDTLTEAAESDPEAIAQLDRRLRELAAAVDAAEDAVAWPELLEKAEASRKDAEAEANENGTENDRRVLRVLLEENRHAAEAMDPELLRRNINELDSLWYEIVERKPGFHLGRFEWLVDRMSSMRDPAQAERIVTQGRRAISNNDVDALKAANRQLLAMLPRSIQDQDKHRNIGGTMTKG